MLSLASALDAGEPAEQLVGAITERLTTSFGRLQAQWHAADNIARHCILDDLLPPDLARQIFEAFPAGANGLTRTDDFRDREFASPHLDAFPPILGDAMFAFHDPRVVAAIERITGLSALEPDPQLYAGGVSMMFEGDYLNPHIDNSHDAERLRYRRLNLLYYVTPGWQAEDGGGLELWDRRVRQARPIAALFNRLVLMETTPASWHSINPVRAAGPRCALRNFYFSPRPVTGRDYYHVTSFTGRPGQPIRRAFCVIDNAARNFARACLGLRRYRDRVYRGWRA